MAVGVISAGSTAGAEAGVAGVGVDGDESGRPEHDPRGHRVLRHDRFHVSLINTTPTSTSTKVMMLEPTSTRPARTLL